MELYQMSNWILLSSHKKQFEHAQEAARRRQSSRLGSKRSALWHEVLGKQRRMNQTSKSQITYFKGTEIDRNRTNSYYTILHSVNVYQYIITILRSKDVKQQAQRSSKIQILHDFTGSPWIFQSLMPQLCSFTEVNTLNCSIHVARVAWRDIQKKRSLELQSWKALRTSHSKHYACRECLWIVHVNRII